MLQPSRQACGTYSFETTLGRGWGGGRGRESIAQTSTLSRGATVASLGGHPVQLLGAELSTLPSVHCLGEINGVFRRVVGIFKPSLTRCQHKQTRKQMVMTREHSCRRERAPWHKRALVLESLDRRRLGHLIDNGGRRGQCFPNARLRKPCRRKQADLSRLLPACRVLTRKVGKGGRGCYLHLCAGGLSATVSSHRSHHSRNKLPPSFLGEGTEAQRGTMVNHLHTAHRR